MRVVGKLYAAPKKKQTQRDAKGDPIGDPDSLSLNINMAPGLDPPLPPPSSSGVHWREWGGEVSSPGTRRAAASFTSAQACCAPFGILRIVLPELPMSLLLAALCH